MWKFLDNFAKAIKEASTPQFDVSIGNFTPRAQQVFALARKEADRFNQKTVGTEHLLLGLLHLGQGVAVNVLRNLGINIETVRLEIEKEIAVRPNQKQEGDIPCSPAIKAVLAFASEEAKLLHHTYVGTEHILLGLLRQEEGMAARIFRDIGINVGQTRVEILKELDPNFDVPEN